MIRHAIGLPGRAARWAVSILCGGLAAASAVGQMAAVVESVEVRVVNFEVVVTDQTGLSVRGLSRADFELLVDGEPTEIDYFTVVENGVAEQAVSESQSTTGSGAATGAAFGNSDYKPLLVIIFDGRDLEPGWSARSAAELLPHLEKMAAATRGVMVVRQGLSLETEQVFTTDVQLLKSAVERAGSRTALVTEIRERNSLIREIEQAPSPELASSEGEALQIESRAALLLRQIKSYQDLAGHGLERSAAQLRSLLRSLAGLPGRKELLYFGRGLKARPAEPLLELWWSKYSSIGPNLGIISIQTEMGSETVSGRLIKVLEEANARQITFNTYSPGGVGSFGASTEFASMAATAALESESDRQRQFLLTLARATGGVGEVRRASISPLINEMVAGFLHFYSLGFDLDPTADGPGKVEVRVKGADYRLRHLVRYRVRTAELSLEDLTLAALVTDLADNPLQMSVDVDDAIPQDDGTWVVPMLVKVPISMLALLPQETSHVGKLQLVVQAQSAAGDLSPPVRGEIPIAIANDELLAALSGQAGYRLRLRVSDGEQKIAVAVRDEVANTDSALNLIIEAGAGG